VIECGTEEKNLTEVYKDLIEIFLQGRAKLFPSFPIHSLCKEEWLKYSDEVGLAEAIRHIDKRIKLDS